MKDIDAITTLHLRNEAQFFTFDLEKDGDLYAINIFKIKEIIKYNDTFIDIIANVPFVEGMIIVRDYNIPVVDMRKWFYYRGHNNVNLDKYEIQSDSKTIMICDFSGILVGIRIYSAQRILTKKWSEITRNDDDSNPSQKVIGHTKYFDGRIVQIVDIEKMAAEAFPWIEEQKHEALAAIKKIDLDKYVLIADDSKPVLKIMAKIMDKLGLKHKLFNNGQELLDFLYSNGPKGVGVIITDLEMPVTSGFEVIKQIKNNKDYKHLPIIVNSSMSGKSNEEMAKSLNADGFVSKSDPKEIESSIRNALNI
ncbi:MAG: chemotaxis protein CheV [Epsilonproteobacteria bacterium]|nr:chemotaxis protein CheV [Campylobacterota bacterium]